MWRVCHTESLDSFKIILFSSISFTYGSGDRNSIHVMPGFEEHLSSGRQVGVILGAIVFILGISEGFEFWPLIALSVFVVLSSIVGSILPDIDHHASIPRRRLGELAALLIFLIALIIVLDFIEILASSFTLLDNFFGLGLLFAIIICARIMSSTGRIGELFDSLITHRGITHTTLFAFVIAIAVGWIIKIKLNLRSIPQDFVALSIGVAFFVGVLTHISDDDV
jgi:hypothetical protein